MVAWNQNWMHVNGEWSVQFENGKTTKKIYFSTEQVHCTREIIGTRTRNKISRFFAEYKLKRIRRVEVKSLEFPSRISIYLYQVSGNFVFYYYCYYRWNIRTKCWQLQIDSDWWYTRCTMHNAQEPMYSVWVWANIEFSELVRLFTLSFRLRDFSFRSQCLLFSANRFHWLCISYLIVHLNACC